MSRLICRLFPFRHFLYRPLVKHVNMYTCTCATCDTKLLVLYKHSVTVLILPRQVSPQQFIPAAAATGSPYGQVIQPALFPVNQQYPISPGVVPAQSPVISPPISTRPGPHMRLPMVSPMGAVVDGGVPSPSQLPSGGVTLVRPVAQVATPTRVRYIIKTLQWTEIQKC